MPNSPASRINSLRGTPFLGAPLPVQAFLGAPPLIGGFTTGNIWYVSSTHGGRADDTAHGESPLIPFASIEYAIGNCTANNGDVIYVLPGHTETIAATDLNVDVAGLQIIGLGSGASRPTLNLTATGSTIAVSAASTTFYNLLITGGVDNITSVMTVSAADFSMINCGYRDVTGQCAIFCTTTAAANRFLVNGFTYEGDLANAGTTRGFAIVGGDRFTLCNFVAEGDFSTGFIDIATTAATNMHVYKGRFRTANSADIFAVDTVTGSTGAFGPELYLRIQDNTTNITEAITGATFVYYGGGASGLVGGTGLLVVNLAGESAMPINITQSTDA